MWSSLIKKLRFTGGDDIIEVKCEDLSLSLASSNAKTGYEVSSFLLLDVAIKAETKLFLNLLSSNSI